MWSDPLLDNADLVYLRGRVVAAGDLTTTYLGIARGVDPAPVVAIDKLKAALGG